MRISLSKKVFFVFASLTSLTLIMGITVYFGIKELRNLQNEKDVVHGFTLQIKELGSCMIGMSPVNRFPGKNKFDEEYLKAQQLVAAMNDFTYKMDDKLKLSLESVSSHMKFYKKAYYELFEKYQLDKELMAARDTLAHDLMAEVNKLPHQEEIRLHDKFLTMVNLADHVYHEREPKLIAGIKDIHKDVVKSTKNKNILQLSERVVHNVEVDYLNYLGIMDREKYLNDTAQLFFNFAANTIQEISLYNHKEQVWLVSFITLLLVTAGVLTLFWWYLTSSYFNKFLQTQRFAMESISKADFDYTCPAPLSNDEMGDLSKFMKEMARKLKESRELYQTLVNNIDLGITLISKDYTVLAVNEAQGRMLHKNVNQIIGKKCHLEFEKRDAVCGHCPGKKAMESGEQQETITKGVRDDGSEFIVRVQAFPIYDDEHNPDGFIEVVEDITEKQKAEDEKRDLEKQIQHVQKLESLGVLAGGIAHDFNNLLMAILGNADLALLDLSPTAPARENIVEIEKASRRAAELCKQMLAYSGKGKFTVQNINLSELIKDMTHMLEISISKRVVIKYNFGDNIPAIKADPSQVRQIIMNLVINASEAIGERSGVISVSTGAMECDRDYLADTFLDEQLAEGVYTYLEVADNGSGMDEEVKAKLFDPFFTTKFTGRGLGMSALLGIVRGHGGGIKLYSEMKKGTTFKILFPSIDAEAMEIHEKEELEEQAFNAEGKVLLVDDDETVLTVGKQLLEHLGFTVLTAKDGREGVALFNQKKDEIDCVILDLTMPHMDGEEAYREMRRVQPDVRVILSSGYNEQEVTQRFVGKGLAGFIQKPYNMKGLKKVIQELFAEKEEKA